MIKGFKMVTRHDLNNFIDFQAYQWNHTTSSRKFNEYILCVCKFAVNLVKEFILRHLHPCTLYIGKSSSNFHPLTKAKLF